MIFFEYLYYRMYQAYTDKNDSPLLRTFMYVSIVMYFFVMVVLIYLDRLLALSNNVFEVRLHAIRHSNIFVGTIIISILLFTYFRFTKKDFSYYEEKYSKCHSLNKSVKLWMLVVCPFLFFFLSIFLMVPLFGGEIFGKAIEGVFGG